jgi:hypothetical protein
MKKVSKQTFANHSSHLQILDVLFTGMINCSPRRSPLLSSRFKINLHKSGNLAIATEALN